MKDLPYPMELTCDPAFKKTVARLVKRFAIEEIVETGTYLGTGSTLVFAQTGLPVKSVECDAACVAQARKNLKGYPAVSILHGYSLKQSEMLTFIMRDSIYEKNKTLAREGGCYAPLHYLGEISSRRCPQDILIRLINNKKRQLILLDSSGGVGYLEFKKVMSIRYLKNKVLMLDDVRHVKHYRSVRELRARGLRFHSCRSGRWGWVAF